MGSCFSKKKQSPSSSSSTKPHFPQENPRRRRSPPPLEEEETVKEVLPISETPKTPLPKIEPKPSFPVPETPKTLTVKEVLPVLEIPQNLIPEIDPKPTAAIPETQKVSFADRQTKPSFPKAEGEKEEKVPTFISADETSEFSEICSVSETISTATIAERRDGEENGGDEVEMRPKELVSPAAKIRRKRSFSGDSAGRIERRAKSPARRSDPSPARRTPVREMGRTNRSRTPTGSTGFRRDTAERRSRSPATRKELGRSPSGRRAAGSPRRRPAEAAEDGSLKVKEGAAAADAAPSASKESLENPLVSLECFIFL